MPMAWRSTRTSSRSSRRRASRSWRRTPSRTSAELEAGSLDGVVGSHLVEHLPPAGVTALVALAGEKLADGGLLILETPNPESLVAGSINFHRDLTHVRPIHPDTLAFLCRERGLLEGRDPAALARARGRSAARPRRRATRRGRRAA